MSWKLMTMGCLAAITLAACATTTDYGLPVHVEGRVVDGATGQPIEGAEVFFVDYTLDDSREKPHHVSLGRTGYQGRFDLDAVYQWDRTRTVHAMEPEGDFGFEITHEGYETYRWRTPLERYDHEINLGTVELTRSGAN